MAHLEHFKRSDVARVCNELEREKRADGKGWKFHPTGEIDETRTYLNYKMEPGHRATDKLAERLSDSGLRVDKRSHVNVMSDWVITCPEELRGDPDKVKRFFQVAYDFMGERYGKENVLQGYVHMDETSPHMHAPILPVKDGRVSAKAVFTRKELRDFHTDLDAVMAAEFGQKGLVKNGRTKGDYTVAELKERTKNEEAAKNREARLDKRSEQLFDKADRLNEREDELNEREEKLDADEAALTKRSQEIEQRERAVEAREAAVKAREAALSREADKIATEATEAAKAAYTAAQAQKLREEQAAARAKAAAARSIQDALGAAASVKGRTGYQWSGKTFSPL